MCTSYISITLSLKMNVYACMFFLLVSIVTICSANPTMTEIYPEFRLIHNHPAGLMDFDIFSITNPEFRYVDCFIDGSRLKRYKRIDENHYRLAHKAMENGDWDEVYMYTWHVPSQLRTGTHILEIRCSETKERLQVIRIGLDMQCVVMDLPLLPERLRPSICDIDVDSSRIMNEVLPSGFTASQINDQSNTATQ